MAIIRLEMCIIRNMRKIIIVTTMYSWTTWKTWYFRFGSFNCMHVQLYILSFSFFFLYSIWIRRNIERKKTESEINIKSVAVKNREKKTPNQCPEMPIDFEWISNMKATPLSMEWVSHIYFGASLLQQSALVRKAANISAKTVYPFIHRFSTGVNNNTYQFHYHTT